MYETPTTHFYTSIGNILTLNGALGEYSLGFHLFLLMAMVLMLGLALFVIVNARGQGLELVMVCMQDVLLGVLMGLMIFTFPGFFYLVGRAFWRAFTWKLANEGDAEVAQ